MARIAILVMGCKSSSLSNDPYTQNLCMTVALLSVVPATLQKHRYQIALLN